MRARHVWPMVVLFSLLIGCRSSSSSPDSEVLPDAQLAADRMPLDQRLVADRTSTDAARPAACLDQDSKLQAALDKARTSPNAMLAVRNPACGTTVYVSGDAAAATTTSLWRIGSVTKTYVAATVLALVASGKLSLGDPLSKWVPGVAKTDGVTLKMLLNHSSGIFNYLDDATFRSSSPTKVWTPAEIVALATTHDPYFAPGAGWTYSNTNYILLGLVLEAAGSAKAVDLIHKHALGPAGLTHTFLDGSESVTEPLAKGYDATGKDVTTKFQLSWAWTAGAMAASGADLCNWVAALYGDTKILDETHRKLMTEGAIKTGTYDSYGLGVELLDAAITVGAGPAMGHGGSIAGFNTQAFWFPQKQTAICAVANKNNVSANDLTLAALKALF